MIHIMYHHYQNHQIYPPPSNKHNIPAPAGAPPPVGAQSRPHSSSRFGDHYPLKPPGCSASRDYTDLAVSLEQANNDRKSSGLVYIVRFWFPSLGHML